MKKIVFLKAFIITIVIIAVTMTSCEPEEVSILPTVETVAINSVSTDSANATGLISSNGGSDIIECGFCWSANKLTPSTADATVQNKDNTVSTFELSIKLAPNSTYYVRAYATNNIGTSYGQTLTCYTLGGRAMAETKSVISIGETTATLVALIGGNHLLTSASFEFGLTTAYGETIMISEKTTDTLTVKAVISNLNCSTVYHYRVKVENSLGIMYGADRTFVTATPPEPPTPTATDADGNIYHSVKIGNQYWLVENLKTTKYNDGTPIPNVTDSVEWQNLTTGAYCNYNNDECHVNTYGRLYNWYSVSTGKLAPKGWHIPTNAEWLTLLAFIYYNYEGGISKQPTTNIGGHLKETGTTHWKAPNTGATNRSGFTALPGGMRRTDNNHTGSFLYINENADWWSANEVVSGGTLVKFVSNDNHDFIVNWIMKNTDGCSIRCIKD